jgi:hypothetical protein
MEHEDPGDRQVATTGEKAMLPSFNLTPRNLTEAMKLAELMARSELVPKDFRGKPESVLVAVQMGAEVGLAPMQAMQNIAVINGRPSVWGDATLAIVQASGMLEWIDEQDDGETATCTTKRAGYPKPTVRTFSMTDAKQAGLAGKEGPWKNYPKRMRQMRARAFNLRDAFADVLRGLAVREEVEDYQEPIDITAEAKAEALMPQSRSETAAGDKGKTEEPKQPNGGATGATVHADLQQLTFEIQGRPYTTNGITKEQLLETFRLAPLADAAHGKNAAAKILIQDFKCDTRVDLTFEQAEKYIQLLKRAAGEEQAAGE